VPRSVVHAGGPRCPACLLPPRYCICGLLEPVETPVAIRVLIHAQERHKPSSSGALVGRAVPAAVLHTFSRVARHLPPLGLPPGSIPPDRELLVLHPGGEPLAPRDLAVPSCLLLLDGTWRQAGEMLRGVEALGRRVRLPDAAPRTSRFWLRRQHAPGFLSTAETLAVALDLVGDPTAARRLELHFELHVLAMLLARGRRESAERYLGESPLRESLPGLLDHFDRRGAVPPAPPGGPARTTAAARRQSGYSLPPRDRYHEGPSG